MFALVAREVWKQQLARAIHNIFSHSESNLAETD
jgi:hypothetical protein